MERGGAEVVVVGAGIAGLATAARLQARGVSTIVLEAHGLPGGCAGYYRRKGFSFDVGATTLVDFGPDGVGGRFLDEIGLEVPLVSPSTISNSCRYAIAIWLLLVGGEAVLRE